MNTSNAYTNYSNYLSNLEMYKLNEFSSIITGTIGSDFQVTGLVGTNNAGFYWKIESNKLVLCCVSTINNSASISIQMPSIYINE